MTVTIATIVSDGTPLDPTHQVLTVDVLNEVNRIPRATMVFVDGDLAGRQFPLLDSGVFAPGKEVEILVRQGDEADVSLFKGLVCRFRLDVVRRTLTVDARDRAFRLTRGRRCQVFPDLSDGDAIGRIVEDAGLTKGDIAATAPANERLVQYWATDWDFILSRADVHGLVAVVADGTVSLKPMAVAGEPVRTFELNESILEVELEVDAGRQHPAIESIGWNLADHQVSEPAPAAAVTLEQGELQPAEAGEALGLGTETLAHLAPLPDEERQAWADARMKRTRLAMIRGRLSVQPVTDVKPMDVAALSGFGTAFDGKALVTGVRQVVSARGGWRTELQLGLTAAPFHREPDIQAADAAGLLPAVRGLQIGVVSDFEEDPELRVKVIVPAIAMAAETALWARLAAPDAGAGRGVFFRPEVGDEVVLGFLNNDPRQPIILGSLFGSKNAPPEPFAEVTGDNIHKGIVSKLGAALTIADDGDPVLTLKTPGGQLLLDDSEGKLQISDQHGNEITLSDAGIVIKSASDLTLDGASGSVKILGSSVDVS